MSMNDIRVREVLETYSVVHVQHVTLSGLDRTVVHSFLDSDL